MSGVRLENVKKSFPGRVLAVNDVSMEIYKKELIVLSGPSGCGKSTLLRLIAGLEEPLSGNIYIDDQLANYTDPAERNIAIVYQNLSLYPHMSVSANLAVGLRFRKLNTRQIKDRITNISDILGISNLLDKYPSDLDAIERQYVAFARAAVKLPRVFLVDRVGTEYDEQTKKRLLEEIVAIHEKLQTTMVVAIDSTVSPAWIGDRIAVMNNGRIEQIGTYEELYNHPLNMFVAGFMGRGHTSFISARVYQQGERIFLAVGKNNIELKEDKNQVLRSGCHIGNEVIIALRPEDILFEGQLDNAKVIEAKVETVEMMNNETYVNLVAEDIHFYVKTSGEMCFRREDNIRVAFDIDKILLLDKTTGQIIC